LSKKGEREKESFQGHRKMEKKGEQPCHRFDDERREMMTKVLVCCIVQKKNEKKTDVKEETVQIGNGISFCYNNEQSEIGDGVRHNCFSG
jgi:hypothetical protein